MALLTIATNVLETGTALCNRGNVDFRDLRRADCARTKGLVFGVASLTRIKAYRDVILRVLNLRVDLVACLNE